MTLTLEYLESIIIDEQYHVFPGTTLTVCLLVSQSGGYATGESACIDVENFDLAKGREIARRKAIDQLFQLEGYATLHKHPRPYSGE